MSFFLLAGVAGAATGPLPVTGDPYVDSTLTASPQMAGAPGDQVDWYQCDASGNVSGPSLLPSASYQPQSTDEGHDICAIETDMAGDMYTSMPIGPIVYRTPTNTAPPVLSTSSPREGQRLTVTQGTWDDNDPSSPYSYSYAWYRCDPACSTPLATGNSYTPGSSDVGHPIEAVVTATNHDESSASTAGPTATVIPLPPVNGALPTISGGVGQGQTLTANVGSWSNSPTGYDYQWLHCTPTCAPIGGAVGATYRLSDGDVGDAIAVDVTAVNAGGGAAARSASTARVTATSTVQIVASPTHAVVNQSVTLVAIVTSSADTADPAGTVTFSDHGSPIARCANVTAPATGQSVTVSCLASFGVSRPSLTVSFTPASGSAVQGSSSAAATLAVARGSSTTSLDVPERVRTRAPVTYTASVAQTENRFGAVAVLGRVAFEDHGKPIAGCRAVRLRDLGAVCTVRYTSTGSHAISARYDGSASFRGSASRTKTVRVAAPPRRPAKKRRTTPNHRTHKPAKPTPLGAITATMQWTFHYTPRYTQIVAFVVHGAAAGSAVTIDCSGRGCPFKSHSRVIAKPKRCRSTKKHACPAPGTVDLEPSFRRRELRVGTRVTVLIRRPRYTGKYYRFTIRARRQPAVAIDCLALGSTRPGTGCTRH